MMNEEPSTQVCVDAIKKVGSEIRRIKEVARIYGELKTLMHNYRSEYLDAYEELAGRFNNKLCS